MSTAFLKKAKKIMRGWKKTAEGNFQAAPAEQCHLCRGGLYPGDPYFALEGRAVCEYCLGRYARAYFAAHLRRAGRGTPQDRPDIV